MTIFNDESELAKVNHDAATGPVRVGEELFEILRLSLEISRETGGAFDVTSGPLSRCWGFNQREGRVPSDEAVENCLARIGSKFVTLDQERRTVKFERPGLELNLGSIGKGFALDQAARMLQNADFGKVLLHAGHSSVTAIGDASYREGGWLVSVRDPVNRARNLIQLRLRNQSLGTSGKGEQFFEDEDKSYGHVMDPRTGRPAEQNLSASCVAPSAALADALATAFFTMSPDSVEVFCRERDDIGAIIVPGPTKSGSVDPVYFGIASSCLKD